MAMGKMGYSRSAKKSVLFGCKSSTDGGKMCTFEVPKTLYQWEKLVFMKTILQYGRCWDCTGIVLSSRYPLLQDLKDQDYVPIPYPPYALLFELFCSLFITLSPCIVHAIEQTGQTHTQSAKPVQTPFIAVCSLRSARKNHYVN
jgi:hypothetical protein